jgi:hypothetical protein
MERQHVQQWFEQHPQLTHGDVQDLIARCEPTVRRHAREDAWIAAKSYVAERELAWKDGIGAHASEAYVARDVCSQLAFELKHHEPTMHEGDEDHLAGGTVKAAFEPAGWDFLVHWIMDVARDAEHEAWLEIVGFTERRARTLISEHHLSADTRFDHTKCYGEIVPRIMEMLTRDYSQHAFPR